MRVYMNDVWSVFQECLYLVTRQRPVLRYYIELNSWQEATN